MLIKYSNTFFIISFCILIIRNVETRPSSLPEMESQCGYKSCPATKPHLLNVHLIPHTHDDVGWLKTVDQYYYGSENAIQKAGVQYILDSVVQELLRDPNKRFIYVESAFFFKWWREQDDNMKSDVTKLVNEGRLEFIGGAWSMNDEATTHYQSIIDQFSWGLRRLNDTFGECGRPRVGWQIDPFGHSREQASIFAQMGFDGLFFGRLDYQDRDNRLSTQKAEMIWRGSANLGEASHLFTGALFNQYQPPPGFCFDILCSDPPIIDGKHSPENNVEERVDEFFKFVRHQAIYYRTNHIIITMGGDFTYQNANSYYKNLDKLIRLDQENPALFYSVNEFFNIVRTRAKSYRTNHLMVSMGDDFTYQNAGMWYKNMDKLIKYGNARQANGSEINLLYSTPSCYLKSLYDAAITWPTKDDDFFPYASDPHAYWTGYFTSRPTLKRFERVGNHFLQVCKQLTALAPAMYPELLPHLSFLRESMGIMQHHDAITGTEKQKVAFSYAKRLAVGLRACGSNTRSVLNHLTTGEIDSRPFIDGHKEKRPVQFEFKTCTLLNISLCDTSESNEPFVLTLYNPLAHATDEYIRIPVSDVNYNVTDSKGGIMEMQYVPIPEGIMNLKFRKSNANYELVFLAQELPPMGYRSYYIKKTNKHNMKPVPDAPNTSSFTTIQNKNITATFDTNGFLTTITVNGMPRILTQEFIYYEAAVGNNKEFRNRSSGAYIFRPNKDNVHLISSHLNLTVYRGDLVQEVHQKFNNWIYQVVRLYNHKNYIEFDWLVGPIPIDDGIGKEIVSVFNSDIASEGYFYTDSNGREMIKRLRNHRDTWNLKIKEETAGNYYPVTTKIALQDDTARMAILTDRAQGGSSLNPGSLELMVHRRLLHDDAFGVEEALNETAFGEGLVARGTHYLLLDSSQSQHSPTAQAKERITQLEITLPTWKFFSKTNYTYEDWNQQFTNELWGLNISLPQNIHLLTLEPWRERQLLVRFEHIFEKDEDPEFSKIVKFNINTIFNNISIANIRETTLDGNTWLDEHHRLKFATDPKDFDYNNYGLYLRSIEQIHLLKASRPMIQSEYYDEGIPTDNLGITDYRLSVSKRSAKLNVTSLNTDRMEELQKIELSVNEFHLSQNNLNNDKFIIEMSPMQIRTFVIFLSAM